MARRTRAWWHTAAKPYGSVATPPWCRWARRHWLRLPAGAPPEHGVRRAVQGADLPAVIRRAERESRRQGRTVGIYPETKHPTYFDSIGLSLEEPLLRALRRNGLNRHKAPFFVQSFETSTLRELSHETRVKLVQLIAGDGAPSDLVAKGDPRTYTDLLVRKGLRRIARYADGIGPDKNRIVPRDDTGKLLPPTALIHDAHRQGLLVHPYTFRSENVFLPLDYQRGTEPTAYGNWMAEYRLFFALGVDGLFSDNSDDAFVAREGLEVPYRAAS